jgi:hypothetical protein
MTHIQSLMKPTYFAHAIKDHWSLSQSHVEQLEAYFIRHWDVGHYLAQSSLLGTKLIYQGTMYHIIELDPEDRLFLSGQVALSFRKPKSESGLEAYVLVKTLLTKSMEG